MSHDYWLAIAVVGLGTFAYRWSFIGLKRLKPPDFLRRVLEYIPVAVLAALVLPGIFTGAGPALPRLASGLAALILALTVNKAVLTIGGGLLVFWVLS